jgi:hypothetical protein
MASMKPLKNFEIQGAIFIMHSWDCIRRLLYEKFGEVKGLIEKRGAWLWLHFGSSTSALCEQTLLNLSVGEALSRLSVGSRWIQSGKVCRTFHFVRLILVSKRKVGFM